VIGVELIPQEEASLRYPDRWAVISAKYASCARRGWFRCRRSADSLTGAIFGPDLNLQREERVPVAGLRVREERVWALIPIMVQPAGSRLSAAVWMIAGRLKAAPKGGGEAAGPDLKQKITAARHRAGLSVNRELVLLYWAIGCDIWAGRSARVGVPR
jgi:hypothetical protein